MTRFDKRKAEILQELQAEAQAVAGRKRAIRAASTAVALALVAAGAWWLMPSAPTQSPQPQIARSDPSIVNTSVNLADYTISDDELLAALDETGEPYTLIWVDGAPQLIEPPEQETQVDSI